MGSKLAALTDHQVYERKRVCDLHFKKEHKNRFNRLNLDAVPILFLSGELVTKYVILFMKFVTINGHKKLRYISNIFWVKILVKHE